MNGSLPAMKTTGVADATGKGLIRTGIALGFILLAAVSGTAAAADCVWFGDDGAWDEPANWSECNGGVPGAADTAIIDDGQVDISGDVTVAGLEFLGGVINGPGTGTHLTVTDTLLLAGEGEKALASLTLVNEGSGQWTAGTLRLRHPNAGPTFGQFHNASGATFEITGAVSMANQFNHEIRIFNYGELIKTGSGLANLHSSNVPMVNHGIVDVQEGRLRMHGGGSSAPHEGSFTVAEGATIEFAGNWSYFGASSSVTGSGQVRFFQNGSWRLLDNMTYDIEGVTRIDGGTGCGGGACALLFNTHAMTGSLEMDTITGMIMQGDNGSLTVNGHFDWHTGTVSNQFTPNLFTLDVLGGMTLRGGASAIGRRAEVHNRAEAVFQSGIIYLNHPEARLINHPDASFEIRGGRELDYRSGNSPSPLGVFDNRGMLAKTEAGTAEIISIIIENSGVIDVQEGSLHFRRHANLSQPWQGARLVLNDGVVNSQTPLVFENSRIYGHGVINTDVEIDNAIVLGFGSAGSYQAGIVQINGDLTLTDTSHLQVRLAGHDPGPGAGYSQLQIDGATELRGDLFIHIDDAFINDLQVGDEFIVMTCSQGCTRFFSQVVVTDPASSGIYFEVEYQGNQVLIRATDVEPEPVDPPVGLVAANDGPVYEGQAVNLSASVASGEGLYFFWTFGDGNSTLGSHVDHVYASPGIYTATVEVANTGGSESTTTTVEVLERPNFAGRVWLDLDGDGERASDEPWLSGADITADGPGGLLSDVSDGDGRWRIATAVLGWYELAASLSGHMATTESPLDIPLPALGSALVDFGLIEAPAPGLGRIVGRSFVSFGQGLIDVDTQALEGRPISLWQDGVELDNTVSGSGGLFAFNDLAPGSYEVRALAPVGHFPTQAVIEDIWLAADRVLSVPVAFVPGSQIAGRVCSAGGAVAGTDSLCQPQGNGVANVQVFLEQPLGNVLESRTTGLNGAFQFGSLPPGDYVVRIASPEGWFTDDGELSRTLNVAGGQYNADWVLHRLGRLELRVTSQWQDGNPTSIGGVMFELTDPNGVVSFPETGVDGRIRLDDLDAGTWVARPDPDSLPAQSVITPASRSLTVANNTGPIGTFDVAPAQSVRARCATGPSTTGGSPFACDVVVRVIEDDQGGVPGTEVYSANGVSSTHLVLGLDAGSFEVRLIPANPAWPEYSETVALNADTHALVNYPYSPSPATADIRGQIFHDLNSNGMRQCDLGECIDEDANGITVRLFDADGELVAITQTESVSTSDKWNPVQTGHFRFPDLLPGSYQVRADLPVGFAPRGVQLHERTVTLISTVNEITIGFRRTGETGIDGRVFIDQAGTGSFDSEHDSPVGGARVRLFDQAGVQIAEQHTASNGKYRFHPLLPGAYQVVLVDPPTGHFTLLERPATLPYDQTTAHVNFPLLANDGRPRVLVFLDANGNGMPDANEQRLAGVQVQLFDAPCHAATTHDYLLTTDADGIATAAFALNNFVGCARAINLPPGLAPVQPNGIGVLKNAPPTWLAVQTLGTLRVEPFIDFNGNGLRNAGEPIVQSVTVHVDGQSQSTGPDGATFLVPPGDTHSVSLTTGSMWQVAADQPLSVYVGNELPALLRVPLVYAGAIQGQVLFNGTGATWTAGTVELVDLGSGSVTSQSLSGNCPSSPCPAAGSFSFPALPPGNYRLRLASPPAGYLAPEEPLIQIGPGSTVVSNLFLFEAGQISAEVYSDTNFNGQRESGEPGTGAYLLRLINDSGLAERSIQPSNNGQFNIGQLDAGVRYALTIDPSGPETLGTAITESPGWFSIGSQPQALRLGLAEVPPLEGLGARNRFHGQVYLGPWHSRIPVAGARVVSYMWNQSHPAADGCDQADPTITGEGFTDAGGHFHVFAGPPELDTWQCLKVVDTPGITQEVATMVKNWGGYPTTGGGFVLRAGVRERDIAVVASNSTMAFSRGSGTELRFSAFRDDNGNALREDNEPMLGGLMLSVAGLSEVTGNNGGGLLSGLPQGLQTIQLVPPPGYRVIGPTSRTVLVGNEPIELPPIAMRPAIGTIIQVFEDWDGDGRQAGDEHGIAGVSVQIDGPVNTAGVTGPSGRLLLEDLPDGAYTVSVTPPTGFATTPLKTLMVDSGGILAIPLQPTGMISGVVYADLDGDGVRGADEPLLQSTLEVRLDEANETDLMGGRFAFVDPAPGTRLVDALWSGVEAVELEVAAGSANGVALSQVSPGTVRGVLWLDQDGDGIRQPWDTPLAGITVTLEGIGATTSDRHGHFAFFGVEPGSYDLSVDLPGVLDVSVDPVIVGEHQGAAVGLSAILLDSIFESRFEAQP